MRVQECAMTGGADDRRSSPIVWRLRLASPPERVWAAWLTPADHERFWCERSDALPGGFRQHFIDGTVAVCTVEQADAPVRLRLRYFDTSVEVGLERRGEGTDLTLTARDVQPHDWHDMHAGWLNVLLPLKAWLDFGIDLRNHDPERTWAQRYVDQ